MYRRIHRNDIAAHLQAGTPMTLVEALPEKYYHDGHPPGALNLPHDWVRKQAPQLLADKSAFIVVYCANTPCRNSDIAARTLATMGYTSVAATQDGVTSGKPDRIVANLPIENSEYAA